MFWLGFIVGAFTGALSGMLLLALCFASKRPPSCLEITRRNLDL